MEAIMAIAMLCQTTASGAYRNLTQTQSFQLECQKEYVACYFGKMRAKANDLNAQQTFLYECIAERALSKSGHQ